MGNVAPVCCAKAPTPPVAEKVGSDRGPALLQSLDTWEFNILAVDPAELALVALVVLRAFCAASGIGDRVVVESFVDRVRTGYLPNPYHNFSHAVDVLHAVYRLGCLVPWDLLLSPAGQTALLVAALAHDLGHPGLSNELVVATRHEAALLYNDRSPLENLTCTRLFEIFSEQEGKFNIFQRLAPAEYQGLRKLMIDVVLSTDVAFHSAVFTSVTSLLRRHEAVFMDGGEGGPGLTAEQAELLSTVDHRALVPRVLLLAADLSNQAKPWEIARAWAELEVQELFLQGDQERELGIPVQPLHDRSATSLPEVQMHRLHITLAPMLSAEIQLFSGWRELAPAMVSNAARWSARLRPEKQMGEEGEEEVDRGPDPRLEAIRTVLGPWLSSSHPRTGAVDAQGASRRLSTALAQQAIEQEAPGVAANPPLVREIRRWREDKTVPGKQREMVLLYIVSDELPEPSGRPGRPVLFRYSVPGSVETGDVLHRISSLAPSRQHSPSPPRIRGSTGGPEDGGPHHQGPGPLFAGPLEAQAAMGSVCRQLDGARFDAVLAAVLDDLPELLLNAREKRNVSKEPTSSVPSGEKRVSWRTDRS